MKVGIVGFGIVGKSIAVTCSRAGIEFVPYDLKIGTKEAINECDVAFVCVPASAIEEVFSWLRTPIVVIKSNVPLGTTDSLQKNYKGAVLFSPEFLREKHWFEDTINDKRVIFGSAFPVGSARLTEDLVAGLSRLYEGRKIYWCTAGEAEASKLGLLVLLGGVTTVGNELKRICDASSVDYEAVRKLIVTDERVSDAPLVVTAEGGFSGPCLPDAFDQLIAKATELGYDPKFLKAIRESNRRFRDG